MAFVDFRFAVVDVEGCAMVEQRIDGTLAQLQIGVTGAAAKTAIGTMVDPMRKFIEKTGRMAGVETCVPFYMGTVAHP